MNAKQFIDTCDPVGEMTPMEADFCQQLVDDWVNRGLGGDVSNLEVLLRNGYSENTLMLALIMAAYLAGKKDAVNASMGTQA